MRLWHYKLIPYLPKSQLLAQWRELNSIFKKQDKHILINYIYDYEKNELYRYSVLVLKEMYKRKYNIKTYINFNNYFRFISGNDSPFLFGTPNCPYLPTYKEHNNEYLTICYYNLKEKYLRGQKDFNKDTWDKLEEFYKKEIKENEYF